MSEKDTSVSGGASTMSVTSDVSEAETPVAAVHFSLDLVAAARRNISFLRSVADADWLHHTPSILEAIRRYDELWMPLISDLTVDPKPPMLVPPLDIEWVWFCHSLNPVHYRQYCESRFSKLIGKPTIFDEENEDYAFNRCREIWVRRYSNEPFENESDSELQDANTESVNELLLYQVMKHENLYAMFSEPYRSEMVYLIAARRRYKKFLYVLQRFGDGCSCLVPASDILLLWLTHESYPTAYAADVRHMEYRMGKVVGPWDKVSEKGVEETIKLWERVFDQPYEKAGGRISAEPGGVYWIVSDADVNTKYKSLQPRFLSEVCVFVRLRSATDGKTREFLRLQVLRCHKEFKSDKPISSFSSTAWQKAWHLYCDFGTKGIMLELQRHPGGHCFRGSGLLDNISVTWNDLLRAASLTVAAEVSHKVRAFTSVTPPVQAPYLLKCVPDNVTDDSGAMISDVILKLNRYRPQEGRWLSRTVLDHAGRECFVVRIRVGGGFWRRGGESPEAVKWEDRIIEIREGSWSYVAGSIGKAPEKVVGTGKPKEELKGRQASWCFSTGHELTIEWDQSTSSMSNLNFTLCDQNSPDSKVKLLKGRKMQYEMNKEGTDDEEEGFLTVIRCTDENPNGKATALLNWKILAMEVLPEEDAVFVLMVSVAILRSVSEMRKEDVGSLLIRRRLKEAKLGARDWGSVIVDPSSCPPTMSSPHLQPWYWNPKAVIRHVGDDQVVRQPALSYSLVEGGDRLYKQGIIT